MKKIILSLIIALVSISGISMPNTVETKNCVTHQTEVNITSKQRCKAITKSGNRCKRNVQSDSKYCWQHMTNTVEVKKRVTHQTKANVTSKQRCKAITKGGNRCKRNAQSGSKYCWQHNK